MGGRGSVGPDEELRLVYGRRDRRGRSHGGRETASRPVWVSVTDTDTDGDRDLPFGDSRPNPRLDSVVGVNVVSRLVSPGC